MLRLAASPKINRLQCWESTGLDLFGRRFAAHLTSPIYSDRIQQFRDEGNWKRISFTKNLAAATISIDEVGELQVLTMPSGSWMKKFKAVACAKGKNEQEISDEIA